MFKYAFIENDTLIEIREFIEQPTHIRHVDGLPVLRPIDEKIPDYDPNTQVLEGPIYKIFKYKVTERYTVRDKSEKEIEQLRKLKKREIKFNYLKELKKYITFNGYEWHADESAMNQMNANITAYMLKLDVENWSVFSWTPANQSESVTLSKQEFIELFKLIVDKHNMLYKQKRDKELILSKLTTAKEIAEYDVSEWN